MIPDDPVCPGELWIYSGRCGSDELVMLLVTSVYVIDDPVAGPSLHATALWYASDLTQPEYVEGLDARRALWGHTHYLAGQIG